MLGTVLRNAGTSIRLSLYDESFIQSFGLIIAAAALFVLIARALKAPAIIAYLVSGLLIGPVTGLVSISEPIDLIAKAGIALLLFLVGIELSFEKLVDLGKTALLAGLGQVFGTGILAWFLGAQLGFTALESLFIATSLTLSSTVVVVKLLNDSQELDQPYGRIAIGILLFQDVVVILFLTLLSGLGQDMSFEIGTVAKALGIALGKMALLFAGVLFTLRYLLARPFAWAARSQDMLFIWSLGWCFIVVSAAHYFHLSEESGAFLAGISLAQMPFSHDVQHRTHPLMNFFVAVFFVTLGIQMNPAGVADEVAGVVLFVCFVLVAKPIIIFALLIWLKSGIRTAFLSAVALSQVSEFSYILLALGVAKGIIQPALLSSVGFVGLVTIAVSAVAITNNHRLFLWVRRLSFFRDGTGAGTEGSQRFKPKRHGHIIVVGMNTLGREIARRLSARGEPVLAIDTDPRKLAGLPCETIHGNVDYLSVLQEVDLSQAKLLVSALHIESINELLAYRCDRLDIPCSINVTDLSVTEDLLELNVDYLMMPKIDGIKAQTRELKRMGILPS